MRFIYQQFDTSKIRENYRYLRLDSIFFLLFKKDITVQKYIPKYRFSLIILFVKIMRYTVEVKVTPQRLAFLGKVSFGSLALRVVVHRRTRKIMWRD